MYPWHSSSFLWWNRKVRWSGGSDDFLCLEGRLDVKSFPLESRPLWWILLWAYFTTIILTLLLLLQKGDIYWMFIWELVVFLAAKKREFHLRFDPQEFLPCYPIVSFGNLLKLLYKCFYNCLVPATFALDEDLSYNSLGLPLSPSFNQRGEGFLANSVYW